MLKKILSSYIFICALLSLNAQDFPKTIYEAFDISPCVNKDQTKVTKAKENDTQGYPGQKDKTPLSKTEYDTLQRKVKACFQEAKINFKGVDKTLEIALLGKNKVYKKDLKWGLRSKEKVILEPQFDFIFVDTFQNGFVGVKGLNANFYDGASGEKVLKKDYLHVKSCPDKTFIVQTSEGFGILKNGKEIIKTENDYIGLHINAETSYFYIRNNDESYTTIYSLNLKEQFHPHKNDLPKLIHSLKGELLYAYNQNFFLDYKTNKELFCNQELDIKMISVKKGILAVSLPKEKWKAFKPETPRVWYLCDFKGNILLDQTFTEIDEAKGEGLIRVYKRESVEPDSYRDNTGLLNLEMEWIVPFTFIDLKWEKNGWKATKIDDVGKINLKGDLVVPIQYKDVVTLTDDLYMLYTRNNRKILGAVTNIKTNRVLKDSIANISNCFAKNLNGINYIQIRQRDITTLYDEQMSPLLTIEGRITQVGDEFLVYYEDIQKKGQHQTFDKNLNTIPLTIQGKEYNSFNWFRKISDKILYFEPNREEKYLVIDGIKQKTDARIRFSRSLDLYGLYYLTKITGKSTIIDSKGNEVSIPFSSHIFPYYVNANSAILSISDGRKSLISPEGDFIIEEPQRIIKYLGYDLFLLDRLGPKTCVNQYGEEIISLTEENIELNGAILFVGNNRYNRNGQKLN